MYTIEIFQPPGKKAGNTASIMQEEFTLQKLVKWIRYIKKTKNKVDGDHSESHTAKRQALLSCSLKGSSSVSQGVVDTLILDFVINTGQLFSVVMKPLAVALTILQAEKNMFIGFLQPTIKGLLRELNKRATDSALVYCRPLAWELKQDLEIR
ncbi:hypothetical protein J437_LFUL015381 [Ladona fulva]|uniref:Uncharacterized protein n=1 Tax=Ladona fulva TaxID=123851 RepID=A0A8K0P4M9_LADFU|nr:hypothetical protein J437_LFUL015381 [Ladona fulva]